MIVSSNIQFKYSICIGYRIVILPEELDVKETVLHQQLLEIPVFEGLS